MQSTQPNVKQYFLVQVPEIKKNFMVQIFYTVSRYFSPQVGFSKIEIHTSGNTILYLT